MAKRKSTAAALLNLSSRVRRSPYFEATVRWGASAFCDYNHMWMPTVYASPQADYRRLIEHVTLWDTAVERQVELTGPDAAKLMQRMSPRDISGWQVGQCRYILVCDDGGGILNDPVGLKLAPDRFWLSIADSDLLLWAKGLAIGAGLDVRVEEPDVSPLQVQGPKATALMRDIVGDWIEGLRFFRFREWEIAGAPVIISRTGWSNERGYEIFLRDGSHGEALWEHIMQAGAPHEIGPSGPSQANRLEAGMLSYGADMTRSNNPFELRLDHLVELDGGFDFVGKAALARIRGKGVERLLTGFVVEGRELPGNDHRWPIAVDGDVVGEVTSAAWSPRMQANLALGYVRPAFAAAGTRVTVATPRGERAARAARTPFVTTGKHA
jgi:aminomethyltransferase